MKNVYLNYIQKTKRHAVKCPQPAAGTLLHCCCSASSRLISSQWWCWRACLAVTCLVRKMLHLQHQTHHFLDESSPHLGPPFAPMSRPCLILVHNCASGICTVTDCDPSKKKRKKKKLNLTGNSQKYIDICLFMFFSLVLFIVLIPFIDQMQSQLLLTSNQIG